MILLRPVGRRICYHVAYTSLNEKFGYYLTCAGGQIFKYWKCKKTYLVVIIHGVQSVSLMSNNFQDMKLASV